MKIRINKTGETIEAYKDMHDDGRIFYVDVKDETKRYELYDISILENKMKQYLTEKQMQQLIDLQIDCSDASHYINEYMDIGDHEKEEVIDTRKMAGIFGFYSIHGITPVYSLTDIIGKLPKSITVDGQIYALEISLSTDKEDFLKKWCVDYGNENKLLFIFAEDELIDAAFKTLVKYYKEK